MVDFVAARSAIVAHLGRIPPFIPNDSWQILDECTIERSWGWVFFYDSKLHRDTGDVQFAIAGNAPFIVRRTDGAILVTGTAKEIDEYIQDFQRDGRLS